MAKMFTFLQVIDWLAVRRFFQVHRNLDFILRFQQTSYELVIERRADRVAQAYLVGFFHLVFIVHLLSLWLLPTVNPYLRVIFFDYFNLLGIPIFFKPLTLMCFTNGGYLLYRIYFTTHSLQVTREALLLVSRSKHCKIVDQASRISMLILILSNLIYVFVLAIILWYIVSAIVMAPLLWSYIWPLTWLSLPSLVSFTFFYMVTQIGFALFVNTCNLAATSCVLITLVTFAQFQSIERVLWKSRLCLREIGRFMMSHSSLVNNVLELNGVYGALVLAFLSGSLPIHITMVAATILEIVSPLTRLLFTPVIVSFPIFYVGIHWMTAHYTRKIHRPYKRIASIFARLSHKFRGSFTTARRWRMASRIETFLTRKPYGITYGSFGLISLGAFFKFLILYCKFVLIAYKNLKKLKNRDNSH